MVIQIYNKSRCCAVVVSLIFIFHHQCKAVVGFGGLGQWSPSSSSPLSPLRSSRLPFLSNNHRGSGKHHASTLFSSQQPHQRPPSKTTDKKNQTELAQELGYRTLYPPLSANRNGTLSVQNYEHSYTPSLHTLYYEEYGVVVDDPTNDNDTSHPRPLTALFLHGGPGAGCFPNHARFFNPDKYRIVLVDQRGSGKSQPRGEIQHNTLLELVHDCDALRQHLGIDQWDVILGGSWGSTVALAYAQTYPHHVHNLILRGVCTLRSSEIDWLFTPKGGAAQLVNADAWEDFESSIINMTSSSSTNHAIRSTGTADGVVENEQRHVLHSYYNVLLRDDEEYAVERLRAAKSWMRYESRISSSAQDIITKLQGGKETSRPCPVLTFDSTKNDWCFQNTQGVPLLQEHILERDIETARNLRKGLTDTSSSSSSSSSDAYSNSNGTIPRPVEKLQVAPEGTSGLSEQEQQFLSFIPAQNILTCYYSVNDVYAMNHLHLLSQERMEQLKDIRCIAVQGGLDFICPPDTALDLLDAWWPSSTSDGNHKSIEVRIPIYAGHSMYDPAITNELVQATDRLASHI